jgi:hypothetical protein
VDPDPEVRRQLGGRGQGFVAARERGMHTDHPTATLTQEPLVLGKSACCLGRAEESGRRMHSSAAPPLRRPRR